MGFKLTAIAIIIRNGQNIIGLNLMSGDFHFIVSITYRMVASATSTAINVNVFWVCECKI